MKYIIKGGKKLVGKVKVSGNKNSVFPCIAASLLTDEEVILDNVPQILDTEVVIQILKTIGVDVKKEGTTLYLKVKKLKLDMPDDIMVRLRGAVVLIGSMLVSLGKVNFVHPGGDIIGRRSIDVHLEAFRGLGVKIKRYNDKYKLSFDTKQRGKTIFLQEPSVTGTENIVLFSVVGEGKTIVRNCAEEPHVVDLCHLLVQMGAKIDGIGTDTLKIEGVKKLHGTRFKIGDDNIEIGTYAIAAVIAGGKIKIICDTRVDMEPIFTVLRRFGIDVQLESNGFLVESKELSAIKIVKTNVWPGFPTDLMSAAIVLATQSKGVTLCHDWMYESRMFFVDKLISMGANITLADPHRSFVYGPTRLKARQLDTPDIRAGMALVLASLIAKGESVINQAELIERGYEDVVGKLKALGADIKRSQ